VFTEIVLGESHQADEVLRNLGRVRLVEIVLLLASDALVRTQNLGQPGLAHGLQLGLGIAERA